MEKIYKELINEKRMLEEIIKKREIASKILEEFGEALNSGDAGRCRELADKSYSAVLEQALAIADGINYLKDISEKFNFSEEGKKIVEAVKRELQISYNLSSRELRAIMGVQIMYGLTNAPSE